MKTLLLFLFVGTSIYAQPIISNSTNDSVKNINMKEITVFGDFTNTFTMPKIVVDKSTLQKFSFNTPADALERESGISLSRDGIWATSVNIRGLSEQRLLFLVDGDRIQTATDIAAALSTIDMSSLSSIEVIKGASSVLYGSGAMGGIVNFVSERPSYSKYFEIHGNARSEFNTNNDLWANSLHLQFTTNQWYLSLNGSFRTAQNMYTPAGKIANSQFNDGSWGLNAGIKYAPKEEFLVNYQHFGAWNVGLPGGSAFPATATVRYKDVARDQLSGEYIISDINPNLQQIRLKAYTQNFTRNVENIVNPTTTILPGSLNTTWGLKATSDWRFTDYHLLVLGAEGWERKSVTTRYKIITASDSVFNVIGEQPTPNAQMVDAGVFAHYSWKIIPRKFTLDAGVRFDYIQTQNDTAFNPVFKYSVNNGVRTDVKNLARSILYLPMVQPEFSYAAHVDLLYILTRNQQLGLAISNSYRAASIEERFKYIDQAGTLLVGNPNLRPEKGTFSNLSYRFSNKNIFVKTDFFANYLNDLITSKQGSYNYINANGISSTVPALINTNVSKALLIGAEMEAKWMINTQFSLDANASYTRARDLDANSFLPLIPPVHGFIELNYKMMNMLESSLSVMWAGRQSEIAAGETATDGHAIINLDVYSTRINLLRSYLQFFGGLDNILNTAYYNHLSTNRGIIRLEPGRNIFLKIIWGW